MQIIYATKSSFTIKNMLPWYFEKMTVLLRKLYEKLFSYDKEVLCCVSFFAYIVYIYLMKLPPRPRSSRVHPPTRQSQSPPEPRPLAPSSHRCPRREMAALLAHATFTALAASVLCEETSPHNNVDGLLPPRSEILAHMPREPAAPSRTPAPS